MKKYIFFIFIFLLFMINVHAEETYTWACQYQWGSGNVKIGIKYQVTNIPESVLKNSQTLQNTGGKYVTIYYLGKDNAYHQLTGKSTSDFTGYSWSGTGSLYPKGGDVFDTTLASGFANKSFGSKQVHCPQLYLTNNCASGTGYFATYSSRHSDETTGQACDNKSLTVTGPSCAKGGKSADCNNLVTYDSNMLSCEYKTDALLAKKSSFKLTYDSKNGLQFDGGSAGLVVIWKNKAALEERFAAAKSQGKCPSRVVCNLKNGTKNIEVGVQSSDFSGSSNCGDIITNNGQSIEDPGNYTALLLQGNPLEISDEKMSCDQLMGKNLVKILHLFITAIRIAGAIIAIVSGMLTLIPAVASDDANALKTATKKCVLMAIILVAIGIFPTIINVIGKIAGFDLSCL